MKWNEGYSEISCRQESDWDVGLLRQLVVGRKEKQNHRVGEKRKRQKETERESQILSKRERGDKMFRHFALGAC